MRPKERSLFPKIFLMYVIKEPSLNESRETLSKDKQEGFFFIYFLLHQTCLSLEVQRWFWSFHILLHNINVLRCAIFCNGNHTVINIQLAS